MFYLWTIFLFATTIKCSRELPYGKIVIENKSNEIIRVTLEPSINWDYFEQRTNKTLSRNPDKTIGGNIIR